MKIIKTTVSSEEDFYYNINENFIPKEIAYLDSYGIRNNRFGKNSLIFTKNTPIKISPTLICTKEIKIKEKFNIFTKNCDRLVKYKNIIKKEIAKLEKEIIEKLKKKIKNPKILFIIRRKFNKTISGLKLKNRMFIFVSSDLKYIIGLEEIGLAILGK